MSRFLAAWAWLRWRVFMNAIERSERVDRVARLSRALEALGPVVVAVMMVPAAAAALFIGLALGFGMGTGAGWATPLMHAFRLLLFFVLVLTVIGPVVLPSSRGIASLPRLLLLPVPHRALFAGELLGGLAEPWTLLAAIAALMVPVGALIAGDGTLALIGLVAAAALVVSLLAVGALSGATLHMLMRDRRRGEWLVVLFFTIIPLAALAPSLAAAAGAGAGSEAWEEQFEARLAEMVAQPARGALAAFPGELFVASVARSGGVSPGTVVFPIAGLAMIGAAAIGAGWRIWTRTIDRGGISRGRARHQLPSAAPSRLRTIRTARRALAFSFLQHVLRTARGRTIVLPPLILTIVFSSLVAVRDGIMLGPFPVKDGFAVSVFGVVMALLTVVQLWMNQFAIDRAGLTMLCLFPVTSAQILRGKMAGAAVLVAVMAALPLAAGLMLGAPRPPAHWAVLIMGAAAAFLVIAPFAVMLAAVFPKSVDLASIGQKSNAHPIAGFLGMLIVFAAAAPALGAGFTGLRYLGSPSAAVALAGLWLLIAMLLHWMLWKAAVATFDRRRETLLTVAAGR